RLDQVGEFPAVSSTSNSTWFVPETTPSSNCRPETGRIESTVPSISIFDSAAKTVTTNNVPPAVSARQARRFFLASWRMDFVTDCNDVIVVFGAAHVKIKSVSIFRDRTEAQRLLHARNYLLHHLLPD